MWGWWSAVQRAVRPGSADHGSSTAASGAASPGGEAAGAAPFTAAPVAGWTRLPAIQRTVDRVPTVSRALDFGGSLATWRDPRLVGDLGHGVGGDEPAGLVSGLAVPDPGPAEATAPTLPAGNP